MNLQDIKAIVNSGLPNWENMLLEEIAKDKNAIPMVMRMLDTERHENGKLVTDLNAELSRAHVALENPEVNKDGFVQKEIRKFYAQGRVNHCYNNMS